MPRYIDADKLCENLKTMAKYQEPYKQSTILGVVSTIENTPTADVAEVVRCRNCKHAYFRYNMKDTLQEIYACRKRPAGRTHKKVSGEFFCKHGERRTT